MSLLKWKADEPAFAARQESAAAAPPEGMATAKPAAPGFAPGTEIGYHPDLVERFRGQHAALQKVFASIKKHATNDEFADTQKSLQSFRRAITSHLLEENIKLYTYLSKCLAHDLDNKNLMLSMKSEMGQIGIAVMRFVDQYVHSGITPFNKRQFLTELDGIGAALVERIEREETSLYTMYMPPEAFH